MKKKENEKEKNPKNSKSNHTERLSHSARSQKIFRNSQKPEKELNPQSKADDGRQKRKGYFTNFMQTETESGIITLAPA